MREQDIPKVMKYIKENLLEIKQIVKFLESQDTKAATDKQKDPHDKFSDEDVDNVIDSDSSASADEDSEDVMNEGDQEKAETDRTSDGVDYPDVGDNTGVEGETLHEDEYDNMDDEDEILADYGLEESGTASVGVATGPAQPAPGAEGSANDGIARVKGRMGDVRKRYDEGVVPLNGTDKDVEAMIESWGRVPKYSANFGGF